MSGKSFFVLALVFNAGLLISCKVQTGGGSTAQGVHDTNGKNAHALTLVPVARLDRAGKPMVDVAGAPVIARYEFRYCRWVEGQVYSELVMADSNVCINPFVSNGNPLFLESVPDAKVMEHARQVVEQTKSEYGWSKAGTRVGESIIIVGAAVGAVAGVLTFPVHAGLGVAVVLTIGAVGVDGCEAALAGAFMHRDRLVRNGADFLKTADDLLRVEPIEQTKTINPEQPKRTWSQWWSGTDAKSEFDVRRATETLGQFLGAELNPRLETF